MLRLTGDWLKWLRHWNRLSAREQFLSAAAVGLRLAVSAGLRVLPYSCWRPLIHRTVSGDRRRTHPRTLALVGAAIGRTDRLLRPEGACLPRALTGYILLRCLRGDGHIHIGVGRTSGTREIRSHAWLESGGQVVVGDPGTGLARLNVPATACRKPP